MNKKRQSDSLTDISDINQIPDNESTLLPSNMDASQIPDKGQTKPLDDFLGTPDLDTADAQTDVYGQTEHSLLPPRTTRSGRAYLTSAMRPSAIVRTNLYDSASTHKQHKLDTSQTQSDAVWHPPQAVATYATSPVCDQLSMPDFDVPGHAQSLPYTVSGEPSTERDTAPKKTFYSFRYRSGCACLPEGRPIDG